MSKKYFYAISRRNLPVHQQAIQAAHAQHEYCRIYGSNRQDQHPTFVWLTVEDVSELFYLSMRLFKGNIKFCSFVDQDIDPVNISAIACLVDEADRHIFESYPLWNCYQRKNNLLKRLKSIIRH